LLVRVARPLVLELVRLKERPTLLIGPEASAAKQTVSQRLAVAAQMVTLPTRQMPIGPLQPTPLSMCSMQLAQRTALPTGSLQLMWRTPQVTRMPIPTAPLHPAWQTAL